MRLEPDMARRAGETLENWKAHVWTAMGFGMIRTYLDDAKEWRLNVWDGRLRVPNVSDIHDHPWDFDSWVLCGELLNIRFYEETPPGPAALPYQHCTIETGETGGQLAETVTRHLRAARPERYGPGEGYRQGRLEIHRTVAMLGTVTLNRRSPPTPEHTARIYWPRGPWVDAKPRPATEAEIYAAVVEARRRAAEARALVP